MPRRGLAILLRDPATTAMWNTGDAGVSSIRFLVDLMHVFPFSGDVIRYDARQPGAPQVLQLSRLSVAEHVAAVVVSDELHTVGDIISWHECGPVAQRLVEAPVVRCHQGGRRVTVEAARGDLASCH